MPTEKSEEPPHADRVSHVCRLRLGGGDLFTVDVKSPLQGEWPGRGCCLAPAPRSDGASGGDSVRLHLGTVPGTPRTADERRLPCRRARNVRRGPGRPSGGRDGRRAAAGVPVGIVRHVGRWRGPTPGELAGLSATRRMPLPRPVDAVTRSGYPQSGRSHPPARGVRADRVREAVRRPALPA